MDDTNEIRTARARAKVEAGAIRTRDLWDSWSEIQTWSPERCRTDYAIACVVFEKLSPEQRAAVEVGVRDACRAEIDKREVVGDWDHPYSRRSSGRLRGGKGDSGRIGWDDSQVHADEGLRRLAALCDTLRRGKKE